MLGKIEGRRRRGWQRMRWLDGITDSMDVSLNYGSWWWTGTACCSPWGLKESDTTEWLNWTELEVGGVLSARVLVPMTEEPQKNFPKLQPVIRQQWALFLLVTLNFTQLKTILRRLWPWVEKSTALQVGSPNFQLQSCHLLSPRLGHISSSLGFSCPVCKMKAWIQWSIGLLVHSSSFQPLTQYFCPWLASCQPSWMWPWASWLLLVASSSPVILRQGSLGQQLQHHLWTCHKYRFLDPTPDLWDWRPWGWGQQSLF